MRIKGLLGLGVVAWLASVAHAGLTTLTTSNPLGSPLVIPASSTAAGTLLVKIVNDVNPDPAASFMTAWQFRLSIVPDGGATGTLPFNRPTPSSPTNPAGPPPYIFASGLGILATKSGGNTILDANDFDSNAAGTQVPTGAGAGLLDVNFTASATASGTFGIFAVRGAATTAWTDASSPLAQTRFFTNVPSGTGLVRIGEVTVNLPEPGLAIGFVGLGLTCLVRRRPRGASQSESAARA